MDYAIYKAGQLGLKLIIPFVNNWPDYGGMDQYVSAHGLQYHDQFYTDATVRQWYKNWISHLVNHVNTISGVAYKDDPTIMIWELANEPRCQGTGLPYSGTCTTQTIISWISDVAAFVKSADSNHLVAVGDEGFFCLPGAPPADWFDNCSTGVDSVGFSQVENVDLMGFHLYPDGWGQNVAWSESFIGQHLSDAAKIAGKPVYMGEFGILEGNIRNSVYDDWTNLVFQAGASGGLFWDLLPGQPSPVNAESQSAFDIEAGSPLLSTIGNFSRMMTAGKPLALAPVAGDQWATGGYGAPVTLYPLGNDVAYGGAVIDPTSIDLDPKTPGRQTSFNDYGGVFKIVGQSVEFTPSAGFNGFTQCAYTVADNKGNVSNIAYLFVTVNPSPAGPETLESFEFGSDGWGPLSMSSAAGAVSQSSAFHTDGNYGLEADVTAGGWFGATLPTPVNLAGRPSLSIDIQTSLNVQSSIAFQSGPNYVWCQNAVAQAIAPNSITTLTIPLDGSGLQCFGGSPSFTDVISVWIMLSASGTYALDNLRAAPFTTPPPPTLLPSIGAVTNSASGQPGAASEAELSIYGTNFAAAGSASLPWSGWIVDGNLPTSLQGVSVSIGGQAAFISNVGPGQINVVAPALPSGPVQVVVTTAAGSSHPFTIAAPAVQPAFFTWGSYVVATHLDYTPAAKNGTFDTPSVPAQPGETILLWGTGFGGTSPAVPIGQEVPAGVYSVSGVTLKVGQLAANVVGTFLSPGLAGVYQVAIQVPASLANGDYPVVATLKGVESPAAVNLTVQK